MNNELPLLYAFMETEERDAICVTETWFDENSFPSFNQYNLYRKNRDDFRHGGEVCIYTNNCHKTYEVLESYLGFTDTSIETVWCRCIIIMRNCL